jgi:hypothetical protein
VKLFGRGAAGLFPEGFEASSEVVEADLHDHEATWCRGRARTSLSCPSG